MMLASSWPVIATSDGGRPCLGTRRLRDTVRVPFVYVRRIRSVSLFESHVSASRPDHALAIRQDEENPRAQTRVALRVQGGPWPVWPQHLGPVLTLPSIEAAGAQPPEHPGRQFPHTGASRGLTPFSADAATELDPPRPASGHGDTGWPLVTPRVTAHETVSVSAPRRDHLLEHAPTYAPRPPVPTRSDPAHEPLPPGAGEQGCPHGHLGSAPYPNARQDSMDRNAGDCSPERPRHGSLDGPRRGHSTCSRPAGSRGMPMTCLGLCRRLRAALLREVVLRPGRMA